MAKNSPIFCVFAMVFISIYSRLNTSSRISTIYVLTGLNLGYRIYNLSRWQNSNCYPNLPIFDWYLNCTWLHILFFQVFKLMWRGLDLWVFQLFTAAVSLAQKSKKYSKKAPPVWKKSWKFISRRKKSEFQFKLSQFTCS